MNIYTNPIFLNGACSRPEATEQDPNENPVNPEQPETPVEPEVDDPNENPEPGEE